MMRKVTLLSFIVLILGVVPFVHAAPDSFVPVVKATQDGVVHISTVTLATRPVNPFMNDEMFRRFFGDPGGGGQQYRVQGAGTGFIIDKKGYIITNNHVIDKAEEITVKTSDKKEYTATVVGRDSLTDIALLKIDPKGAGLKELKLGDSDKTEIGEWVIAIGSPRGYEWSVTAGIVSAKGRDLSAGPYDSFIQTDTAINPGNSGGPLLNMSGEVIGINSMIRTDGQGLGFAVPVNMLKDLLPQLMDGKVRRGWIGITLQDLDEGLASSFGLPDTSGALVADVLKGEPAEKAGIKPGDIIKEVDGKNIENTRQLVQYVGSKRPGENVKVTVIRDGKVKTFTVKLAERQSADSDITSPVSPTSETPIKVRDLSKDELSKIGVESGVLVTSVLKDSNAEKAGLAAGDVITWVNRTDISSSKQLAEILDGLKSGDSVSMRIVNSRGTRFIAFKKD